MNTYALLSRETIQKGMASFHELHQENAGPTSHMLAYCLRLLHITKLFFLFLKKTDFNL